MVSGTARFTVGDSQYEAPAGTFVSVPIGAEHTFANPGEEPATGRGPRLAIIDGGPDRQPNGDSPV